MITCTWRQEDEDSDAWITDCNEIFELWGGTPKENRMRFCCFCAKPIEQEIWVEIDWEGEHE